MQSRLGMGNFGSRRWARGNVEFDDDADGSSASGPSNLIFDGSVSLSFVSTTTEAPDKGTPQDVAFDAAEVRGEFVQKNHACGSCGILIMLLTPQTHISHALPKPRYRSEVHYLLCREKAIFISFDYD